MKTTQPLRALSAAAPLAIAALLAAAPQASAAIGGTSVDNPQVAGQGKTLNVQFGSDVSSPATDNAAAAQSVASALGGTWLGGIIQEAMKNAPASTVASPASASSCHVTVAATDPSGAKGTASATIQPGASNTNLAIPDQAAGTKWVSGDLDHFTADLTCTDGQRGSDISKATIDEDGLAS